MLQFVAGFKVRIYVGDHKHKRCMFGHARANYDQKKSTLDSKITTIIKMLLLHLKMMNILYRKNRIQTDLEIL